MTKQTKASWKKNRVVTAPVPAASLAETEKQPSPWVEMAVVSAGLLLFLVLSLTSVRRKSSTFDEGAHIPAAYTYVALGDYRLNPEHPPLVKLLAGLPLRFLQPKMELDDADWKAGKQWEFGLRFLYEWNDADRLIFWARLPVICLALLLGVFVWHCARAFYGSLAGYLALLLFLFNPDMLAHGQLVTTDLAVACFLFLAVYCFYRALRQLTMRNALLVGLTTGLCLSAKFSGVLIFPMLALVGAAFAVSDAAVQVELPKIGTRTLSGRRDKFVAVAGLAVAAGVMALVVIWAAYGFRYQISPDPAISRALDWPHFWLKETLTTSFLQLLQQLHLLPEGYIYGFLNALESLERRFAFLLGESGSRGWWYYFIVTFLVKTPLPLLILIVLGGVYLRRYGAGGAAESMLLLPPGLYWLVTLINGVNIGHRHLLPIYPFLIVFAAKMARAFVPPRPPRLAVVCGLLLGWYVVGTLLVYPHFLAYFNEVAGGPTGGRQWLSDSNLDWGQDLKALAQYRREHPDEPFYLSYFGSAYPEYYGIKAQSLPGFNSQMADKLRHQELARFADVPSGATVAISATNLSGVYLKNYRLPGTEEFLQRLRGLEPVARIGYSIYIYRLP